MKFDPKTICKPVLSETKGWFDKAVPNPQVKNFTTQLGCHFEEVGEMIAELTPENDEIGQAILDALTSTKHLGELLKRSGGVHVKDVNRRLFLDAICDQLVTGTGIAHMLGMDPVGGLDEVNRGNFSKFDPETGEPIFDDNMKVAKGPAYVAPDLTAFV